MNKKEKTLVPPHCSKGQIDSETIRMFGLVVIIFGMLLYWIIRYFVLQ
ncbi:MAG: hypothetical protein LBE12_00380 [Planctomycetaceae bacterium]|jgi:phage shock protein PspC (stress-responsive transcriptional regulator)|nr:hypothetical protein [Planctomycetaceae bacterium]